MFWEQLDRLLLGTAFPDAAVLHTDGSGFFPGALVACCWCGSKSSDRDFSPSPGTGGAE